VHNVSQLPNLRHLGESLGGAKRLLDTIDRDNSVCKAACYAELIAFYGSIIMCLNSR